MTLPPKIISLTFDDSIDLNDTSVRLLAVSNDPEGICLHLILMHEDLTESDRETKIRRLQAIHSVDIDFAFSPENLRVFIAALIAIEKQITEWEQINEQKGPGRAEV